MAIRESDGLLLLKGGKHCILLCAGERYHLIHINAKLTEEKENQLRQIYPCSDQALHDLGINFTVIQKNELNGVSISGAEAGCELSLCVGKSMSKYILSDDTTMETLEGYFHGIKRMKANKRKMPKASDQWRKEAQDPQILKRMKKVRLVLTIVTICSAAAFLFHLAPYKLWVVLNILCPAVCVFLAAKYPVYFTLLDLEKTERGPKYGIGLGWLFAFPCIILALRILYIGYLTKWAIYTCAAIFAAVLMIFLWCFVKEYRSNIVVFLCTLLIAYTAGVGMIGQLNYVLDTSPEEISVYTVEGLDREKYLRTGHYYECTITLENGETYEMKISRKAYNALSVGDQIKVARRAGSLGLEYIYLIEE